MAISHSDKASERAKSAYLRFESGSGKDIAALADSLNPRLCYLGQLLIRDGFGKRDEGSLWLPEACSTDFNVKLSLLPDPYHDIRGFVAAMNSWMVEGLWKSHTDMLGATKDYFEALKVAGFWDRDVVPLIPAASAYSTLHIFRYRMRLRLLTSDVKKTSAYIPLAGNLLSYVARTTMIMNSLRGITKELLADARRP